MKFSARHDIETPSAYVFAALSDFEAWERAGMRRGADVTRTDKLTGVGPGMAWKITFLFRGRKREASLKLLNIAPNSKLEFAAVSSAIDASLVIDIVEMSARRSRLHVTANLTPLTLTAKLFIQSLRLARARADRKFSLRIAAIAADIEERYRSEQMPS